jgi:hypothetical protein
VQSTWANRPVEIAADLRVVNDTIRRYADKIKLMEA